MRFRVPGIGFYETGGILDWGGGPVYGPQCREVLGESLRWVGIPGDYR